MYRSTTALVAVFASTVLTLAACSSPGPDKTNPAAVPSSAPASSATSTAPAVTPPTQARVEDATSAATTIKAQVSSVVKVVSITENNDPNNLIGRPNGYTSAAVLYEKSVTCSELGASCGATLEVWASESQAKARAAYIQKSLTDMPVLGTEYDYIRGSALLRVSGEVKPSVARKYNAAFGGTLFG